MGRPPGRRVDRKAVIAEHGLISRIDVFYSGLAAVTAGRE